MKSPSQPEYVCAFCGDTYGRRECDQAATWHVGTCGVCGDEPVAVTQPRDYGGLYDTWKEND